MTAGSHDVVECDFENLQRLYGSESAEVFDGVLVEEARELVDFGVGEAGVGLADILKLLAIAYCEGVVAEHAGALAVAELCSGDDNVQCGQFALQLQPSETALARLINAV